jgi:hypothetical protein
MSATVVTRSRLTVLGLGALVAASLGIPPGVRAQDSTAARPASPPIVAHCDSLLRNTATDSERVVVRMVLGREDGGPLPEEIAMLALQEIGTRFRPPQPFQIPVFASGPARLRNFRPLTDPAGELRTPLIHGVYGVVVGRTGEGRRPDVLLESLVPGLDSAVIATLREVSAERAFPYLPDEIAGDSIVLHLRLTSMPPASSGTSVDLFVSHFPRFPVVDAALVEAPAPEFPAEEKQEGITGDVLLQVVVAVDGRPYPSTVEIMQGTTFGFIRSALAALSRMRWTPARVLDCPVPQQVMVPFHFGGATQEDAAEPRR